MPYIRKTQTEYQIQGNYSFGFETVNTELTRKDASRSIREYRENEPGIAFRIKSKRVPLTK